MGAAETKAGHDEEYVDGTSAAPWPQLDGVRRKTSPALVDDRRSEDGEGRGGAKYDNIIKRIMNYYDANIYYAEIARLLPCTAQPINVCKKVVCVTLIYQNGIFLYNFYMRKSGTMWAIRRCF